VSDDPDPAPERMDPTLLRRRTLRSAIAYMGRLVADPKNDWVEDQGLLWMLQSIVDEHKAPD
jgi:hypothetical protein